MLSLRWLLGDSESHAKVTGVLGTVPYFLSPNAVVVVRGERGRGYFSFQDMEARKTYLVPILSYSCSGARL